MYIYYKITVTNQPPGHVLTQYNTRYPSLYIYISTTKLSKLLVTSHLIGCFDLPWCGGYRGEPQSTACLIGQHKGNKRHSSPLTTQGGATWGVGKVLRIRRAKKTKWNIFQNTNKSCVFLHYKKIKMRNIYMLWNHLSLIVSVINLTILLIIKVRGKLQIFN